MNAMHTSVFSLFLASHPGMLQNHAGRGRFYIKAPVEGPAGMISGAGDMDLDLPSTARARHERDDGREDGRATPAAAQRRSGGAAERHGGEARPRPSSGDSGGRRCGAGGSELRRPWELGISTGFLKGYVPTRLLQINHSALSSNTRCFYVKTAPTRVVLSLQLGPTRSCTRVRRFSADGDGIVTSPCVFQYRNCCIRKYSDVTEIYGQVLWLPVYFTLF
jgi:hypothetical protein